MKVTFVYPNSRVGLVERVARGEAPDTSLLGQNHLAAFGIDATIHNPSLRRVDRRAGLLHRITWNAREVGLPWELRKDELTCNINHAGKAEGKPDVEVLASSVADGQLTVLMKLPAAALGLEGGQGGQVKANFERFRQDHPKRKGRGREYTWMAKMRPPWNWPMRYGTLTIEAAK